MATSARRPAARARRLAPCLEELEPRHLPSGAQPTVWEQLLLEQLNDARANPAAYGAAVGLDLSSVAPAPPLAFDARLVEAAQGHSLDMSARDFFAHTNPDGVNPAGRLDRVGFPWVSAHESIAAGFGSTAEALRALIVDAGVPDLGHRRHLLALDNADQAVGVGVVQGGGSYRTYFTIDSARGDDTRPYLTGVVYLDGNHNNQYDVGEGVGGATVTVWGVGEVTTFASGGYSFQVDPGDYWVTVGGGGLPFAFSRAVSVGPVNVRLNFVPGDAVTVTRLTQAAAALATSAEYYQGFVRSTYVGLLGREPDAAGLSYWVGQMQRGLTDEGVEASFLGSAEYIAGHGVTAFGWVVGLYNDLLGRAPGAAEVDHWLRQLALGVSTTQVAYGFAASAEREAVQVGNYYRAYLGRAGSAEEIGYWVSRFTAGTTNEIIKANFVGTLEYYHNPAKGNGDRYGWVWSAYLDLLHRPVTPAEAFYWAARL